MTEPTFDFDVERSILVSVPALSNAVCDDGHQLFDAETESVVAVLYDRSADTFLRTWRDSVGTVPKYAQIVDVEQTIRSTATEPTSGASGTRGTVVQTVQRPDDLSGVETAIESALASATGKTTLVFDSLTSSLEHVSLAEMVPFFRQLTELLADFGATGYFYLDRCAHDRTTVATLRALTNATAELTDDGAEWSVHRRNPPTPDTPSLDVVFDVLRSKRRRETLRYLLSNRGPVDVKELATAVADFEEDDCATRNQHRRYYTTLYQLHLPKLDDAGLIDHDTANHRVSIREMADLVAPFLALAEE
ncbi:hypothetical protein SAMN05421858_1732 [Haladaptatus litoreus]|uniref:DUF7344 domain-containing protein n=1 Tax=Haladaptatus litoreus TaxID=553468 RepID=A0A1N6YVS5_9EURY|nr:hypothetical protein [Haladaptatus litoreus]SIR18481.1 hypothetical protein SAMN05421858_1732 [Haladaptatus litoreus]